MAPDAGSDLLGTLARLLDESANIDAEVLHRARGLIDERISTLRRAQPPPAADEPPAPVIAFVGLGNIGSAMVRALLRAGHVPRVFDIVPARVAAAVTEGAIEAASLDECARGAHVVFLSLPMPADVANVMLGRGDDSELGDAGAGSGESGAALDARPLRPSGLLAMLAAGSLVVDMSTNAPAVVAALARRCDAQGVQFVDAPVNDAPAGTVARSGQALCIMLSGDPAAVRAAWPHVAPMADTVLDCGATPGAATACKLLHNAANAACTAVVGEAVVAGVKMGIPLETVWASLRAGSLGRSAGDVHGLAHY